MFYEDGEQPTDDLADRTAPCPQTRCVYCEELYDKPQSDAIYIDKFCSKFCEDANADRENEESNGTFV